MSWSKNPLMSESESQAAMFYREVAQSRVLWTIRDEGGFPAPKNSAGQRAQPFWSSEARVEEIVEALSEQAAFIALEISWEEFCSLWAPALAQDGIRIGLNWSDAQAAGYDVPALEVQQNVEALLRA